MGRLLRLVVIGLLVALVSSPASAGGSWLYSVEDRQEAGDTVLMVGGVSVGQFGWIEDGPFFVYLRLDLGDSFELPPILKESDLLLGELQVEETGPGGARAWIRFTVPSDLPAGEYAVTYCDEPCEGGFGDLIGGSLYVGVDPPAPPDSGNPFTDAELDALLATGTLPTGSSSFLVLWGIALLAVAGIAVAFLRRRTPSERTDSADSSTRTRT